MRCSVLTILIMLSLSLLPAGSDAQDCPSWGISTPKDNVLYLYFPTASDATFPDYSAYGASTSPADPFDVADLDATIGTTAELRDRIFEMVIDDYCEFNVDVRSSTTAPSPSEPRWQILAIGSDSDTTTWGETIFGEAQAVDTGDADAQDYSRVWAGSFGDAFGGPGQALGGTNSTLDRWATAIAGTASHEAGHNYGLSHAHADPVAGEDGAAFHILATTSSGLTGELRAGRNRHFSDTSYEILGHNVGLNFQTVHNWDFINPNSSDAHGLVFTLLSPANSLATLWVYSNPGFTDPWPGSPWINPTITSAGSLTFQGTLYNVFEYEYSTGQAWLGGPSGVVPPGVELHVGATFDAEVIVYEVTFKSGTGTDLPLRPRMVGYDTGSADLASGDFMLGFFNTDPERPLELRDLSISYLPRMAAIETMVTGAELTDLRGLPIVLGPPPRIPVSEEGPRREDFLGVPGQRVDIVRNRVVHFTPIAVAERVDARLAGLAAQRHVDITYDAKDCERGRKPGLGDVASGELEYCPEGTALSLFPATTVYVTATVVDPRARYFDRTLGRVVEGPLESKLFYQLAGFVPDFNDNGVDDLLDIRNGGSEDDNGNGVPDDAEPDRSSWSIHAGVVSPRGRLASSRDDGVTLNLDWVRQIRPRWAWDLRLGLSRFEGRPGEPDLDVWTLAANLKHTFNPHAPARLFVNGGGGLYYFDPGGLEGGYNLGVGLAATLTSRLTAELTYNYHSTFTASPQAAYSQVQLGLLFSF